MKGIGLNRSTTHNEWFEELCALAAIGELSASEFAELQKHLTDCSDCRELHADFCRISSDDIGSVAIQRQAKEIDADADSALDEQAVLGRFMERAEREREARLSVPPPAAPEPITPTFFSKMTQILSWFRLPVPDYVAIALLLAITAGVGAYQLRDTQLSPILAQLRSQVSVWQTKAEVTSEQERSASQLLQQTQSEREALLKSLAEAQAKYEEVQAREKNLAAQLTLANAQIAQKSQDLQLAKTVAEQNLQSAKAIAEQRGKTVEELRGELRGAMQVAENEGKVLEDVRRKLKNAEETQNADLPGTAETPPVSEEEAKELFGARDLHIVDVYDVDSAGKRRRTFGRVFYAEKKQLIFYAFNLEGKKPNRSAESFQAWGYLQANQGKPESLGIFNLDDASVSRWVLKVNNQLILQHIDALFVTLEPPGGSPVPRGRKLLYAYLNNPPNHP
jgi:predicted  nucleic acid-binding Zn-ribbon protein